MTAHRYTLKPSVPDIRDHVLNAPKGYHEQTRAGLGVTVPYRNQGQEGACGGFATTSAVAAMLVRLGKAYTEYSAAAAYYWARTFENSTDQDSGSTIQDEMKALVHYGAAPAALFPYTVGDFCTPPPASVVQAAEAVRAAEYWRVVNAPGHENRARAALKYALDQQHGIVIGIGVYQSFEDADSQGRIPMPKGNEKMLGGHALYVHDLVDDAGYEGGGYLMGDGSWGNTAPFMLPYAYAFNSSLAFELRTFALKVA